MTLFWVSSGLGVSGTSLAGPFAGPACCGCVEHLSTFDGILGMVDCPNATADVARKHIVLIHALPTS